MGVDQLFDRLVGLRMWETHDIRDLAQGDFFQDVDQHDVPWTNNGLLKQSPEDLKELKLLTKIKKRSKYQEILRIMKNNGIS